MEGNDSKYIYLPLHLIDIIPEKITELISYGIVRFAETFNYKDDDVYRQIVYLYYQKELPYDLVSEVCNLINDDLFTDISDYNGFDSDGIFDPEENIKELSNSWDDDVSIYNQCVLVYRIHLAADALSITLPSYETLISHWKYYNNNVVRFEEKYGKDALISLSLDMAIDYRDNDKNAYEIELLKGFLAIKSIQGKSKLCETNKAAIVMRMTGAKNTEVYKEKKRVSKRLIEKYENRYHIDKLLSDLRINGFIQSKIPNNRSLFISTSLNEQELAKAAFELVKNKMKKTQKAIIKSKENKAKDLFNQMFKELKNNDVYSVDA